MRSPSRLVSPPQTIYFTFKNQEVEADQRSDRRSGDGAEEMTPQEQAWWKEMLDEPDPTRSLQIFIKEPGRYSPGHRPSASVRSCRRTDEEVREVSSTTTSRYAGRDSVRRSTPLATKGALRSDLPRDRLLDVFLVVYGDATYHQFTTQMDGHTKM